MSKTRKVLLLLCFSATAMVASTRDNNTMRNGDHVLEQETRNAVYQLIKEKPGLHFRQICRELNKRMGVIQYHVSVLEKTNFIRSVRDGRYKCFFAHKTEGNCQIQVPDGVDKDIRETMLTNMRRKTPKVLLAHLIENNQSSTSHQELSKICDVSPQAITFHCQRLERCNIIASEKKGRQKYYYLTEDAMTIVDSTPSL